MGLLNKVCQITGYASSCACPVPAQQPDVNPDPKKYVVLGWYKHGRFLVLEVWYPNAINFEGKKILVFKGKKDLVELLRDTEGKLDPHFCPGFGPVARFEPTVEGRRLAKLFVRAASLYKKKNDERKQDHSGIRTRSEGVGAGRSLCICRGGNPCPCQSSRKSST